MERKERKVNLGPVDLTLCGYRRSGAVGSRLLESSHPMYRASSARKGIVPLNLPRPSHPLPLSAAYHSIPQ